VVAKSVVLPTIDMHAAGANTFAQSEKIRVSGPPQERGTSIGMVAIGDGPMSRIRPTLWLNGTTPGWFATMGIPLRSGRDPELVFLRSFPGAHQIPQRLMCRVGYPHGG
jgi:hypothetical protein